MTDLDEVVRRTLDERGLHHERARPGAYLVRLEGTHRLATMCWLVVGEHSLQVEAFFCRRPEERAEDVYRFLLQRNTRMYAVGFALDNLGDVYIVGRLPLCAVQPDEVDRLLGSVLTYADESFDKVLELGFGEAIRREWDWRVSRGESLRNLQAFARFADPARRGGPS